MMSARFSNSFHNLRLILVLPIVFYNKCYLPFVRLNFGSVEIKAGWPLSFCYKLSLLGEATELEILRKICFGGVVTVKVPVKGV